MLGRIEHELLVEFGKQHEAGADAHREGEAEREAVGVKHRQHAVDGFVAGAKSCDPGGALRGIGTKVVMAEDGALGGAGRAARVLQHGGVGEQRSLVRGVQLARSHDRLPGDRILSRPCGERGPGVLGLLDRQLERQPFRERHRVSEVDGDDIRYPHVFGKSVYRRVDLVPDDRDAGAVVFELVAQLAVGVERIVLDHDGAEAQHRVEGHHVLRAVRKHEGHPVARAHPEFAQAVGGTGNLLAELIVAGGRSEEVERDGRREPFSRRFHHVGECFGDLGDRAGNAGGV